MADGLPRVVGQVMIAPVGTVPPAATLSDALRTMRRLGCDLLLIEARRSDERHAIITRDAILRAMRARAPDTALVRDVMVAAPLIVAEGMRIEDCAALLLHARARWAVVVRGGRPAGVVRTTDLFQAIEARR
jgi:signal-transduction protein with cAMP-binding, CBS, and nucleotidyltransferase domain